MVYCCIVTSKIKWFSSIRTVIAALVILIISQSLFAAGEDIGGFDIEKVRKAAQYSDTGLTDAPLPAASRESIVMVILRIMLYLGIVIVLILGVSWFFRQKGLQAVRGGGGAMDIVETLTIGQNRMLVMVRVLDEIYLLAQTSSAITLIDKIGGQKAMDIISSSKGGGTIMHFKDAFNSFMGKMKKTV